MPNAGRLAEWRGADASESNALFLLFMRSSIAAEQTRRRIIPIDECACCGSKFGSTENYFGASWGGRGFHAVADRRRCDELDLVSRPDSPCRWDDCFLGTLSGGRIFCALLHNRLRAVVASTRAAEGDVGAKTRGLFTDIAFAVGK